MQTLNQDIKDHSFKPVYLLFGEEAFLKKSFKKRSSEFVELRFSYKFYKNFLRSIISEDQLLPVPYQLRCSRT